MLQMIAHWRTLEMHEVECAFCLAFANAGNSIPARIAIIAITTSSSIRVNPLDKCLGRAVEVGFIFRVAQSLAQFQHRRLPPPVQDKAPPASARLGSCAGKPRLALNGKMARQLVTRSSDIWKHHRRSISFRQAVLSNFRLSGTEDRKRSATFRMNTSPGGVGQHEHSRGDTTVSQ